MGGINRILSGLVAISIMTISFVLPSASGISEEVLDHSTLKGTVYKRAQPPPRVEIPQWEGELSPPATRAEPPPDEKLPQGQVQPVAWQWNPPGEVMAPILLYHQVGQAGPSQRYFVSTPDLEIQLDSLLEWGYTVVPLRLLVEALLEGAYLPTRPVVITFDDGYRDVYENAFPLLQRRQMVATVLVITQQIGVKGYLKPEQIQELAAAGWEIGSHSQTHPNLRQSGIQLESEISGSRDYLSELLGVPIVNFAYPYGLTNANITRFVAQAGYLAGLGLGGLTRHTTATRYYLSRIEVRGDVDADQFADLLPWVGTQQWPAEIELLLRKEQVLDR